MFDRLKQRLATVLKWTAGVSTVVGLLFLLTLPRQEILHPKTPIEIHKVAAQIMMEQSSGSGTVLRSSSSGSDILTVAHVCEGAAKSGAIITINRKSYQVQSIKPSQRFDLCLMRVGENLYLNTEIAPTPPSLGSKIMMGGFPLLLPMITQDGYASELTNMGDGNWVLVTSMVVEPGYSGSAVYDAEGKIVGVMQAFKSHAATDSMGFGLAVPQQRVKAFIEKEERSLQWIEVPRVPGA